MLKNAWLVMAHTNLNQLKKLLKLLDNTDSDIYIHIDRKSSVDIADLKTQYSKLYVFKEYSVYWGEYSQISVELLLLKAAVKKGNYNYIHLISGMDLPLMSIKKMNEFLERGGTETMFILYQSIRETLLMTG